MAGGRPTRLIGHSLLVHDFRYLCAMMVTGYDAPVMDLSALLLSRDSDTIRIVRRVMQDLSVHLFEATEPGDALELLCRRKFDAFIADCDDLPGGPAMIQQIRQGQSNRSSIVFALINGRTSVRTAFELGANFVIDKPMSLERSFRSFRAGHGLMVREARRYFRCDVDVPITVECADGAFPTFATTNVSEGGLAVSGPRKLRAGVSTRLTFTLPGNRVPVEARGEVAWVSADGRAGIRLVWLADRAREALCGWIAQFEAERSRAAGGASAAASDDDGRTTVKVMLRNECSRI